MNNLAQGLAQGCTSLRFYQGKIRECFGAVKGTDHIEATCGLVVSREARAVFQG